MAPPTLMTLIGTGAGTGTGTGTSSVFGSRLNVLNNANLDSWETDEYSGGEEELNLKSILNVTTRVNPYETVTYTNENWGYLLLGLTIGIVILLIVCYCLIYCYKRKICCFQKSPRKIVHVEVEAGNGKAQEGENAAFLINGNNPPSVLTDDGNNQPDELKTMETTRL